MYDRPDETLIFLHLPKTAGSTLRDIIRRQYQSEKVYEVYRDPDLRAIHRFAMLPLDVRAEYRALIGHMYLGVDRLIPGPSTYITLLRDPVERAISAYYFVLAKTGHREHAKVSGSGLDFEGVLKNGLMPILANSQTQALCTSDASRIPYGGCSREMLEQAKQNVMQRFAIAGTTSRFDETLLILKDRFQWKNVYYAKRNRGTGRPRRQQLPAGTLDLIEQYNQLDLELYRFVEERLERRIEELGARFQRRLFRFRHANAAMASLGRLHAKPL